MRRVPAEVPVEIRLTIDELRRRYIQQVLDACDGNRSAAARILGVDRKTLGRRLQLYAIPVPAHAHD